MKVLIDGQAYLYALITVGDPDQPEFNEQIDAWKMETAKLIAGDEEE